MSTDTSNQQGNKKKKRIIIPLIIGIIILFCGAISIGLILINVILPKVELQNKLNAGNTYYSGGDYKNAILSYQAAIDINPGCEEAYIALAKCYNEIIDDFMENDDIDAASAALKDAISDLKSDKANTNSKQIAGLLDDLKDRKKELESNYDNNNGTVGQSGPKGQLIVATNAEFPPYEYYDESEIVGIDIEIINQIAKETGYGITIEDMSFDSVIPSVSDNKADLGIAAITVTDDRLQYADFSDPYIISEQVVIVREDSSLSSIDDLYGINIGVKLGTTGDIYADDLDVQVERYLRGSEAVEALTEGKVDAVITDKSSAKEYVKRFDGTRILDESFTYEEFAVVVPKGNKALLDEINSAISKLKKNGTIDKIKEKYINAD